MHAKSASFLWLIGSFRHKNTSLLQRIIGVPKYCVKEREVWDAREASIAAMLRRMCTWPTIQNYGLKFVNGVIYHIRLTLLLGTFSS